MSEQSVEGLDESDARLTDFDLDWNFAWEQGQYLKRRYSVDEDLEEFPYFKVNRRFFDPDEWELVYQLVWMHPVTMDMKTEIVTESNALLDHKKVDEEELDEVVSKLKEEADE